MHKPTFDPWVNTFFVPLDPGLLTAEEAARDPERLPRLLLRPVRLIDERNARAWAEEHQRDGAVALIVHLLLHARGDWSLTGRTEPVPPLPQGLLERAAWVEETLTYKEARLCSKAIWDETRVTQELEGN